MINALKYAEHSLFCKCVGVYKNYEGIDYDKIYEVLSTLKIKKLKINKILIATYKNMLEYPNTPKSIYQIGHNSIRIMKRLAYYDPFYYENINYFDLMTSFLKY